MKALLVFLICTASAFIFTGCATTEPDNVSERPWNAQKGWEHGLPSTINEGR